MRGNLPWLLSLLVVLVVARLPSPPRASACQIAIEDPRFDGIPTDGATDVPTNVVPIFFFDPWYDTTADGVPGTFVIETLEGEPVDSHARLAAPRWFEIVPARLLEPNTAYRIRGHWTRTETTFETELEFTTGAGPRTDAVEPPVAHLQHLDWQTNVSTSCDNARARTCVAFEEDAMVAYELVDASGETDERYAGFARTSFFTQALSGKLLRSGFRCIRLRTRAVDATLSDTTTLCGEDAPVFHVAVDRDVVQCTDHGLVWPEGASVTKNEEKTPPPARSGDGKTTSDARNFAAGSGGTADPSEPAAAAADPDADAKHVKACSVQPGLGRSTAGPTAAFAVWLTAWFLRRRRSRSRSPAG